MIDEIDKVIEEMDRIAEALWKCEIDSYQILANAVLVWQQVLQKMLEDMLEWNEQGAEIPTEIILAQCNNFACALEKKDVCMLADVLKYELAETLKYYKGLVEAYDRER